jgi:hypothetical protein
VSAKNILILQGKHFCNRDGSQVIVLVATSNVRKHSKRISARKCYLWTLFLLSVYDQIQRGRAGLSEAEVVLILVGRFVSCFHISNTHARSNLCASTRVASWVHLTRRASYLAYLSVHFYNMYLGYHASVCPATWYDRWHHNKSTRSDVTGEVPWFTKKSSSRARC